MLSSGVKVLLLIGLFSFLTGCGRCQRTITHWTGDLTYKCSKGGAEYVQSDSGIAVHVNPDTGLPYHCTGR